MIAVLVHLFAIYCLFTMTVLVWAILAEIGWVKGTMRALHAGRKTETGHPVDR